MVGRAAGHPDPCRRRRRRRRGDLAAREVFRRLRGYAGIGGGDVRLFAVAGAWVGLAALPGVLFLSGIFGLLAAAFLVHRGWVAWGDRIPFVPALSAALWVVFLAPQLVQP